MPGPALCLAHRGELLDQARDKMAAFGIVPNLERAEARASLESPVVLASVQSWIGSMVKVTKELEKITYEKSLASLIKEGWLIRILARTLPVKIDLREVRRTAGRFQRGRLVRSNREGA
jgi:superfamily II DNA or RNA helicase